MNDIRRCATFAFCIAGLAALAGCGGFFESAGSGPAAETVPELTVGPPDES